MSSTYFDYSTSTPNIRGDLPLAFREVWQQLGQTGSWFTGSERIAIAAAVRSAWDCRLCRERKDALSANAVQGDHDGCGAAGAELHAQIYDAVHRIATDAPRLSRSWLDEFCLGEFTQGHYIELLGIVVAVVSIDAFHLGMGLPPETLPKPSTGANEQPDHYLPEGAADAGAWVPVVQPAHLATRDIDIYGGSPSVGNVISAMSLVPDSVRMLMSLSSAQYLPMHKVANPTSDGGRALSRAQIELLAGRVSSLNQCFY